MEDLNFKQVTTKVQAHIHLDNNEVLLLNLGGNEMIYVRKLDEDKHQVVYQPRFGTGQTDEGPNEMLESFLDKMFSEGESFIVIPGAEIKILPPRKIDKFINRIKKLFKLY
jgi:hypothetical protein